MSLKDWDGDPSFWHVENGAIVGVSTKGTSRRQTYIVFYRRSEAKDFDLKLEIKVQNGGGSGIQYRSKTGIPWRRPGPNLPSNLDWVAYRSASWYPVGVLGPMFTGQFYSENTPLGFLAWRGQVVNSSPGQRRRLNAVSVVDLSFRRRFLRSSCCTAMRPRVTYDTEGN
jgi:hypothetical protein